MICPRCLAPLIYERDPEGRFTMLFSTGQNGSLFCTDYHQGGTHSSHIAPTGLRKVFLKLMSRFEQWDV